MSINATGLGQGGLNAAKVSGLQALNRQVVKRAAMAGMPVQAEDGMERLNDAPVPAASGEPSADKRRKAVEAMNELVFGTLFKMMLDKMYESGKAMREGTRFDGGYAEGVFNDFMSDAVSKKLAHQMGETPLVQMALDPRAKVDSRRLEVPHSIAPQDSRSATTPSAGQTIDVES